MSSPKFLQSIRCLSRSSCQRRSNLALYSLARSQCQTQYASPSRTRPFSVSSFRSAALAQQIPSQPTVLLETPSAAYLEEEEIDVEPIPPEKVRLVITDRAAEQLRSIATRENNPQASLRIAVESGGCHGYQYKMDLAKSRQPDDYHFTHPTIQPANLVVDAVSLTLLNGSTIDYATELIGSSFRIDDNPQAKGSGCGCGVSWELKDS